MRWFIDEAYEAYDDEAWDAVLAAYLTHIGDIAPGLPPDLRALATEPRLHLHDARLLLVVVDQEAATVEMLVGMFDGKRALRMVFGEARFIEEDLFAIACAVGATYAAGDWGTVRTYIMAQEVELEDGGRFLLRLRLYPFHEFGLSFRSFSLAEEAAPPDDGQPGAFSFANEPEDD